MILILFLCIKLSILSLCVSDPGYECKQEDLINPKIFLVEDKHENIIQYKLNEKFKELCGDYYNITIGPLVQSKELKNVIQFAVKDFHIILDYDKKPLRNFVYAGNISKTDNAVCTKTNKNEPKFDCNEIVNFVSQPLKEMDGGNIYDFVLKMNFTDLDSEPTSEINYISDDYTMDDDMEITHRESCMPIESTTDLPIVLFCYSSNDGYLLKRVNILRPLTMKQIPSVSCQDYLINNTVTSGPNFNFNRLLAVLAPHPFEVPTEYLVPTIFYEAPYMLSEDKAAFPNSNNLMPWRLLKYGFLKFIQNVGWQRVAIVTDDSEYSIDFEDELTALFSKERLAYTVIRCENAKCEMGKITQELISVTAKIVVANVNKKNAEYLLNSSSRKEFVWLLRDTGGKINKEALRKAAGKEIKPTVFFFSLHGTKNKDCNNMDDNILTGLNSIAQAYKYTANIKKDVTKQEFYRHFAETVKRITPRITEAIIEVHTLHEDISSMTVNENGLKSSSFNDPYANNIRPNDGTEHCLVTSYNFDDPCDDFVLIFFMFIIMTFVVTFLMITCYFDKTAPLNDMRYQNF